MSHTPGPWRFEHDPDGSMSEHDDPLGVRYIRSDGHMGALMGGTKYYPWTPDNVDDWYLIAAAPDLLNALKSLMDSEGDVHEKVVAARNAIAKAEGR